MAEQAEQVGTNRVEYNDDREWANWWQSYWSGVPDEPPHEGVGSRQIWRESAHEFDFGGEE